VSAPVIVDVEIATDRESATITWTTDVSARGVIRYRQQDGDDSEWERETLSNFSRAHLTKVDDLSHGKTYELEITAEGDNGQRSVKSGLTFATLP
jgi:hypothetical protein